MWYLGDHWTVDNASIIFLTTITRAWLRKCPEIIRFMAYLHSDSDYKPNKYIVLCRTFHVARSQIRIPIQMTRTGMVYESGSESESVDVNRPL